MKKSVLSILLAFYAAFSFAQLNMTLTDQIDYTQNLSSLWGYIDPEDGTEYAAVGTMTGLSVVDISDPYNVQEIAFVPDVNSLWREVKSWGHYIYAVTEGGGGMLVVNMTDPNNVTSTHWAPNIPGLGILNKVHSITVDEFGYLYLNGSNLNGGAPIIVDVSTDDGNPVYVGKVPFVTNNYTHDSYARNNILYTSDVYNGNFKVWDISDRTNPILLATQTTPYAFTHNAWLNDASDVIFTTDEKANAPVAAYDISDLDNIVELDQFRPVATIGVGAIPHNVHVWNDWVVTAYYTEGTIIIDGSRPDNMIEVGNFDSFVPNPAGFFGVWGVYPYFPSGVVIASDMQNGLMVFDVNYVRACWLEGKVTNAITGAAVSGATVSIASSQPNAGATNLQGTYKTGQAIPGVFDVTFTATGYFPKTVQATLENNVLTLLDVALEPLVINPFPPFTNTSPTAGCAPLSIDFFETSGVAAAWAWTFENGNPATSTEQNPTVQFTVPGIHDVSLTVTTQGGNTYNLSASDLVIIAPSPTAAFDSSVDSLSASFTNNSTNYNNLIWDFGDGSTSTEANPKHNYQGAGTYTVTLTTYGDCGSGVLTQAVTIGPFTPVANFGSNITSGCAPFTVSFADLSTNAPTGWSWSFPGGTPSTSTEQNPTVTFSAASFYNVQLVVENAAGSDEITLFDYITVDESPVAGFAAAVNGPEVQFSNAFMSNIETYSWDFGDGGTDNVALPAHTYTAPGIYTVVLTVANNCGSDSYSAEITIPDFLPTASFNADITVGCAPLTVAYADQSSGQPIAWQWAFPGGNPSSSTEQNPVIIYNNAGTYNASLSVENIWGSADILQNDLIVVNGAPTVGFNFNINGNEIAFTNNAINADSYQWIFNDGAGNTSTELNPVINYPGPGTYEVVLNATNGCGTATYSTNITIADIAPTAAFTLDNTQGCAPMAVQFTDQSTGGPTAWAWSFPGGTPATSTEQNPIVTYITAGVYGVTLTVTNSAGMSESTQTDLINLGALPFAASFFTVNELEVTLFNISENAESYAWDFGDGSTSTEESPVHTYAANGFYTVVLTATNGCGSTSFEMGIFIAVDAPAASFVASQSQGCAPFEVVFADQSAGLVTGWAWAFPGGTPATSTEQNPTVTYDSPGSYDVSLTVTGPGGSTAVLAAGAIVVEDLPVAGFNFVLNGNTVTFTNTSQSGSSYLWDFGDSNGGSLEENPVYSYGAGGIYDIVLTVTNNCGTDTATAIVAFPDLAAHELGQLDYLLTASPNPFGSTLRVNYELKNSFANASLLLSDVLGQVVGEWPLEAASGTVELGSEFNGRGVYFLRLVVDGQVGKAVKVVRL